MSIPYQTNSQTNLGRSTPVQDQLKTDLVIPSTASGRQLRENPREYDHTSTCLSAPGRLDNRFSDVQQCQTQNYDGYRSDESFESETVYETVDDLGFYLDDENEQFYDSFEEIPLKT